MNKIIKHSIKVLGIIPAATAGVAIFNALNRKSDEEVGHEQKFYEKYAKRPIDFLCASSAVVVLSPIMICTAIEVRRKLGSPVIFKQDRPGRDEKIFRLFKYRTMTDERDGNGKLLPDAVRLTKFGHFLRSTSLDELPELFNIIKGDMSVIGPRPLAVQYLPYYNETERQRHSVRPGLSGLAQVNGRTSASWDDRFKLDVEYVNNITFLGDIKLVFQTLLKVFKRADIVEAGSQGDFDKYRIRQLQEAQS